VEDEGRRDDRLRQPSLGRGGGRRGSRSLDGRAAQIQSTHLNPSASDDHHSPAGRRHRDLDRSLRFPPIVEGVMTAPELSAPGPANIAHVQKNGEKWTLVLVKDLRHSPEKVWQALTAPAQLREWAPFDADRSLGAVGTTVKLTTVVAPTPQVSETRVTRA